MTFGGHQRIKPNPKRVFYQRRDDSTEQVTADLQTGIKVNLNQIGLKGTINDEIEPKELKVIPLPIPIQLAITSPDHIAHNRLHLADDILEVIPLASTGVIQIPLKL